VCFGWPSIEFLRDKTVIVEAPYRCHYVSCKQGFALRGNGECGGTGGEDVNEGNFIELIIILAKYDVLLKDHLKSKSFNHFYFSPQI